MLKYDLSWSTESLKTQKEQWQTIDRRRTNNPMAKINKDKKTTNDPENNTLKTIDWAAWNSLTTGGELGCSERESSLCSTSGTDFICYPVSNKQTRNPFWN